MKAFFHRLQRGAGAKDKDRDVPSSPKEKFPPLPSWPPPQESQRPTSTTTTPSIASFKPLPELVPVQISSQLTSRPPMSASQADLHSVSSHTSVKAPTAAPPTEEHSQESSTNTSESVVRPSRKNNGSASTGLSNDVQKKVAFISPPQTPVDFDRALPDAPTGNITPTPVSVPLKTTVSRFQAAYGKEPRVSTSAGGPSASKTDVATPNKTSINAATSTSSPYLQKFPEGGSLQSLRSGTPYSQMSNNTSGSRILAAQSWSEVTEGDLVSNLGSRERTRQEVLFEIISSEERCEPKIYPCFFS